MSEQQHRRGFRPEIQALRAVAVSAVVFFHLWPGAVRGGYVGVDVFFVISGFLITQQLADELTRTGRISLTSFWARRIRRILPAALAVLGACVLLLVAFMPRLTWPNNLDEIRAAAAYGENWLLGIHSVDYLAAENSPSLVQHYWSLSVEEQFYLVWPLLLVAAPLVAARTGARRKRVVVGVLAGVGVASLVTSVVWTAASPSMAFFATPTRGWEFAAGGLVGLLPAPRAWRWTARARLVVNVAGAVLIGYAVFFITQSAAFPGWIALVPVVGAALVLAAVAATPGGQRVGIAGHPLVQWLGDNSYSIYLWHWPLIVALPWVTHVHNRWPQKVVIFLLSLGLAAITKRFVEDPIRRAPRWRVHRWPAYALGVVGVAALVAASSGLLVNERQAEARSATASRAHGLAATRALVVSHHRSCFGAAAMVPANHCARPFARPRHLDTAFAAQDGRLATYRCLSPLDATTAQLCDYGRISHPKKTIAVVGNSHARRLIPALALYGQRHGWRVVLAAHINCMGLISSPISAGTPTPACQSWSADVQRQLLAMPGLDAVIWASHRGAKSYLVGEQPTAAELQAGRDAVLHTWSTFAARGIRNIVTEDVPGMRPYNDPECIAESRVQYDPCTTKRTSVVFLNFMTALARSNPQLVHYVRLTQYFCDARLCHGLIGGVVVYFDSHHITTTFSRSLAPYLGADVAAILSRPAP